MVDAPAQVRVARVAASLLIAVAMVVSLTMSAIKPTTPAVDWVPAATVLMLGPTGVPVLSDADMASILNGRYAGDDHTRVNVEWPAQAWPQTGLTSLTVGQSVAAGIEKLEEALQQASGPTVVLGISQSALVVDAVQRRLAADPNAPGPDQLSFVVVADMNRGNGIFTGFRGVFLPILNYVPEPEPVTPHDVLVVAKEYDGWADFPDRWWNLLSTLNAIAGSGIIPGFGSEHNATVSADLSQVPQKNITTTVNSAGGTTTTYLVPTPDLPLLAPLTNLGVPKPVVDTLNNLLKPVVDAGYSRNDSSAPDHPTTNQLSSAATESAPPESTSKPLTDEVRKTPDLAPERSGLDTSSTSERDTADRTDSDTDVNDEAGNAEPGERAVAEPDKGQDSAEPADGPAADDEASVDSGSDGSTASNGETD